MPKLSPELRNNRMSVWRMESGLPTYRVELCDNANAIDYAQKKHRKVISFLCGALHFLSAAHFLFANHFIDTFRSCTASLVRPDARETGM